MSIRKFVVLAALAVFGVMAIGAASASATLRADTAGAAGTIIQVGTTIQNTTADPAVLVTQAGTVTCNQTLFDADVTSNSAATAGLTLTTLTFTSCTDTILAVNISSCHLHLGSPMPTATVTPTATGGTLTLSDTVVRCTTSATQGCYYTAGGPQGTALNSNSSITFSGVVVGGVLPTSDAVPVANCGSSGTFSTTLTHVVTSSNATVTVTTS